MAVPNYSLPCSPASYAYAFKRSRPSVPDGTNFWNSRWRRPPSWKSFFGHYSSTDCPISTKFCMRKQNSMLTRTTGQKMQMCKIQDSRRPPFWKSLNCHLSVKNCLILMKFDTLQQISNSMTASWPKILKIAFIAITHRPIVRFQRHLVSESKTACRQKPRDKKFEF